MDISNYIFVTILSILFINTAYADNFQITNRSCRVDVSYAHVSIISAKFEGDTDKFGRITIDLPRGSYKGTVKDRSVDREITFDIDGDKSLKTIDLPNSPPVVRVAAPAQGQVDQVVSFDASGSSDPDGDALTYAWDFGDGTPTAKFTFPRTTHRYARLGNYTVKVTVDDGCGANSATLPVSIIRP